MRPRLVALAIVSLFAWSSSHQAAVQGSGKKALHAFLAAAKGSKRTTTFSADAPVIYAFWEGESLDVGDTIGAVWIAEDIGGANPKETEIRRAVYRIFQTRTSRRVLSFEAFRPDLAAR